MMDVESRLKRETTMATGKVNQGRCRHCDHTPTFFYLRSTAGLRPEYAFCTLRCLRDWLDEQLKRGGS